MKAAFARIASRPIPRVSRFMGVARESGYDCVFLAARRETGLAAEDQWDGSRVMRIGPEFPLLNGTRPFLYLRSILSFNLALFAALKDEDPDIVHASDIETMPAAALFCKLRKRRLIYNIHDNFAQRYGVHGWVAAVMNAMEGMAVLASQQTLVPEAFRRNALPRWCQHKVAILRNTPVDQGAAPLPPLHEGRVRLFFAGWLDWGRGLGPLLDLVAADDRFEMRVAGEGSPDIVAKTKATPRVEYLGYLGHEQIMEEARQAHLLPALYDPARTINRFAASNKLAESLSLGRPPLVNCEMAIVADLQPYQCFLAIPYRDVSGIGDELVDLIVERRDEYLSMCRRARVAYEDLYSWQTAKKVMEEVFRENGPVPGRSRASRAELSEQVR